MERQRQKGFTLVEMAIVLVIIGIILAAVMKGRDMVFSAGETQAEQAYLSKWVTVVNDYYKGVRAPLTDGAIHGGLVGGTPDGYMDGRGVDATWTAAGFTNYRAGGVTSMGATERDLIKQALNSAGLNPCVLLKSNLQDDLTAAAGGVYACAGDLNPFEMMIDSEYAGRQRIMVGFSNYILTGLVGYPTTAQVRRNFIIFHNVPLDIAVRFDTIVDGIEGGNAGKVLNLTNTAGGLLPQSYAFSQAPGNTIAMGTRDWPRQTEGNRSNVFTVGYMLDF